MWTRSRLQYLALLCMAPLPSLSTDAVYTVVGTVVGAVAFFYAHLTLLLNLSLVCFCMLSFSFYIFIVIKLDFYQIRALSRSFEWIVWCCFSIQKKCIVYWSNSVAKGELSDVCCIGLNVQFVFLFLLLSVLLRQRIRHALTLAVRHYRTFFP